MNIQSAKIMGWTEINPNEISEIKDAYFYPIKDVMRVTANGKTFDWNPAEYTKDAIELVKFVCKDEIIKGIWQNWIKSKIRGYQYNPMTKLLPEYLQNETDVYDVLTLSPSDWTEGAIHSYSFLDNLKTRIDEVSSKFDEIANTVVKGLDDLVDMFNPYDRKS